MKFILLIALLSSIAYIQCEFPSHTTCSCPPNPDPLTALNYSSAVISGTVIGINQISLTEKQILFCVKNIWKGPKGTKYLIRTAPSLDSCGYPFKFGLTYIVYSYTQNTKLWTSVCSRTIDMTYATDDLAALPTTPLFTLAGTC